MSLVGCWEGEEVVVVEWASSRVDVMIRAFLLLDDG